MQKVLVTGAAGYIGRHVVRHLSNHGYNVIGLDLEPNKEINCCIANITDYKRLKFLFKNHLNIDAVIHLAGLIDVAESFNYPDAYYQVNYKGTENLLNLAIDNHIKSFVFASSAAVYSNKEANIPSVETHELNGISPYGKSKQHAEKLITDHRDEMNTCILRLFNVAGAHKNKDIGENHKPETHLIPNTINAINNKTSLDVYGNCVRDYVHVCDVADAFIKGINTEGIYNIGSGIGRNTLDVIKSIEKMMSNGFRLRKNIKFKRQGDVDYLVANIERANNHLQWSPKRNLGEILNSAIKWHSKGD